MGCIPARSADCFDACEPRSEGALKEFSQDAWMWCTGKMYKPSRHSITLWALERLNSSIEMKCKDERGWTFMDLGCGKGTVLPLACSITKSPTDQCGKLQLLDANSILEDGWVRMFDHVVGVELDPEAHAAAVGFCKVETGGRAEVICGDMFQYVKSLVDPGNTVFYIYEPLWLGSCSASCTCCTAEKGLELSEIRHMYTEMLAHIASLPSECAIVYMAGIHEEPHITKDMFLMHNFTLLEETCKENTAYLKSPLCKCWRSKDRAEGNPLWIWWSRGRSNDHAPEKQE